MENNELYKLLKKYRDKACTDEEKQRLHEWYHQYDEKISDMPAIPKVKLDRLRSSIDTQIHNKKSKSHHFVYLPIAAAVAVILVVAACLFSTDMGIYAERSQNILAKAGLGDCRQVTLCDGSKVYLNSCSSLTYPETFSGSIREVKLDGEAYFEIAKGKRPFIVKTSAVDVRVYGTSFNVASYQEDAKIVTTLVNGSVHVYDRNSNKDYDLKPGRSLSYVKKNGSVEVEEVNTAISTAWQKGEFIFTDMRLEDILNRLKHWYDFDISYEEKAFKDIRLCGSAEKIHSADFIMRILETVAPVKLSLKNGHLSVKRK